MLEMKKIVICLKCSNGNWGEGGGGQFWVKKNDSGHNNSFLKVKPILRW